MCVFLCFCCYLSEFAFTIYLGFVFCFLLFCLFISFLFVLIPFIVITDGLLHLHSLTRDLRLGLETLGWKPWVQDTRLLKKYWPQGILISENSHKDVHLYLRPGTTPIAGSARLKMPRPNNRQCKNTNSITNHPLTQLCPSEGHKLASFHQNTGTSPSQHEAFISHWTNLTHWGQRPKTKGTMTL